VLFRNTRAAVKGFPDRVLHAYPLGLPEQYSELKKSEIAELLTPEVLYQQQEHIQHWTQIDPRINWLSKKCAELNPQKILVIAANANTALDITQFFNVIFSLHITWFCSTCRLIRIY
jgi:ATP-dependent helicase HepA